MHITLYCTALYCTTAGWLAGWPAVGDDTNVWWSNAPSQGLLALDPRPWLFPQVTAVTRATALSSVCLCLPSHSHSLLRPRVSPLQHRTIAPTYRYSPSAADHHPCQSLLSFIHSTALFPWP